MTESMHAAQMAEPTPHVTAEGASQPCLDHASPQTAALQPGPLPELAAAATCIQQPRM
jgi:hypothetical protein